MDGDGVRTIGLALTFLKLGVSKNSGTPKSSILIGFSIIIINHPFWGIPIFGNTHWFGFDLSQILC